MHPSLKHTAHRPWPMPGGRWAWRQSWHDLLFAHWAVPPEALQPLVPPGLTVEAPGGTAWVGVVPFRMSGVVPRGLPDVPWISAFPELNLRIYVTDGARPGVFFLSLDAARRPAVWAARAFFHLPYFWAKMRCTPQDEGIAYSSVRRDAPRGLAFRADYAPAGPVYAAEPGTLEHSLTERYGLYTTDRQGRLLRCEIHHAPWPLQPAEATVHQNEIGRPHGLDLKGPPALLHFARRIDVVVWNPEVVRAA